MSRLKIWNEATGAWEYVGGGSGSDEVFIQADDPIAANPLAELWYDTDAVASTTPQLAEIFYSEITADVSVTATSAATAQNIINPGNVAYDGTPIMLEFFVSSVNFPFSGQMVIHLFDGNTDLGYWGQFFNPTATTLRVSTTLKRRITPTAGLHNYNIRAWSTNGGNLYAQGFQPVFLRATRVLQVGATIAPPQGGLEANRPAAGPGYTGLRYFATDTLRDWLCDGIGWIIMREPEQTYVPTLAGFTLGTTSSVNTGRFNRSNGWCDFDVSIVLGAGGAMPGTPSFTLPKAPKTVNRYQFPVRLLDSGVDNYRGMHEALGAGTTAMNVYMTGGLSQNGVERAAIFSPSLPFVWGQNDGIYVGPGRYQMQTPYL